MSNKHEGRAAAGASISHRLRHGNVDNQQSRAHMTLDGRCKQARQSKEGAAIGFPRRALTAFSMRRGS